MEFTCQTCTCVFTQCKSSKRKFCSRKCYEVVWVKQHTRHGHCRQGRTSGAYSSWKNMIGRCTNPRNTKWDYYGGRGITVCARWREDFENFLTDMGERPIGKTLDRYPNNDGNYEPSNCRWASKQQQRNNVRPEFQAHMRVCNMCGIDFKSRPAEASRGRGKYCSNNCKHAAQRKVTL
jgi:hypothetical protein